jgi:hypothetical protein
VSSFGILTGADVLGENIRPLEQDDDIWYTVACHEAAHAVMQWLRGTGVREIALTPSGGLSNGTGRHIDGESYMLITFAGFAYEFNAVLRTVQFDLEQTGADDIDDAREILTKHPPLRLGSPRGHQIALVEESMQWWFKRAADELLPHHELIEHIGTRLLDEGRLSGRSLAAMCREWKRER